MTTVENNTFTGPNAGVAGGYVPLTTIESTSMDGDLDLVKDDLDYHLSILQAIYIKLDTIEIGATATPSASAMVSTINTSAELIDADNLESTVALLSNIISDIEAHRVTTIQSAMHPEDSIKSTDQVYSYTPSSIVTSCQNVLDEINNIRIQIHKILGQTTWIDTPNTTLAAIKTKLDTIESGATADQTDAEIRTLVESATDSNVFTDTEQSKLNDLSLTKTVVVKCIADIVTLAVGDAKIYFTIPIELNGMNIITVGGHIYTASSSGLPTFQIHNATLGNDVLSTKISIDVSEKDSSTATTAPVINTSYDHVSTGDEIRFDCDISGTSTRGMEIRIGFALP
jgi:hypothetical protein